MNVDSTSTGRQPTARPTEQEAHLRTRAHARADTRSNKEQNMSNIRQHVIGAFCAIAVVAAMGTAFIDEPRVARGYNAMTPVEIAGEAYAQAVAFERSTSLVAAVEPQVNRPVQATESASVREPTVAATQGRSVALSDWRAQMRPGRTQPCQEWSGAAARRILADAGFSKTRCERLMIAGAAGGDVHNRRA